MRRPLLPIAALAIVAAAGLWQVERPSNASSARSLLDVRISRTALSSPSNVATTSTMQVTLRRLPNPAAALPPPSAVKSVATVTSCPSPPPASTFDVVRPASITSGAIGEFTAEDQVAVDQSGPHWYVIYAGYLTDHPDQGVVVVVSEAKDPCSTHAKENDNGSYVDPIMEGAVGVVSATGSSLDLYAEGSGRTFQFSARSRTFS